MRYETETFITIILFILSRIHKMYEKRQQHIHSYREHSLLWFYLDVEALPLRTAAVPTRHMMVVVTYICTTTSKTVLWSQGDRWVALKSFSIKLKNWCRLRIQCTVVWQCVKISTPWQFLPDIRPTLLQLLRWLRVTYYRSLLCVRLRVVWVISVISSRAFSCRVHINPSTVL